MNVLNDPILRTHTRRGSMLWSLPTLLAGLGEDDSIQLAAIQRHQQDVVHVFLCQLAVMVLARSGACVPTQSEAFWRSGLLALTGGAGERAWDVLAVDPAQAAFLQPPSPAADGAVYGSKAVTPDQLDLLLTAKNHDVKTARAVGAGLDEWVYALIDVQTADGYLGRGNHGIARMNGGYGTRVIAELIRSPDPAPRWRDAVPRLFQHREEILAAPFGYRADGLGLVWTMPWDGRTSLPLAGLDPCWIDACRRLRLRQRPDGSVEAAAAPTDAPRVAAKELRGVVGDPWLLIDTSGGGDAIGAKALHVSTEGFTADVLRRVLFDDGILPSLLRQPGPDWREEAHLVVSGLVRGQGTTGGFREASVVVPAAQKPRLFGSPGIRQPLADLARMGVEQAGTMLHRVLKRAVFAFIEGGPDEVNLDRPAAQAWWRACAGQFEALWSADYFPWLWSVETPDDFAASLHPWVKTLRIHAEAVLGHAQAALPRHSAHSYGARVKSERVFRAGLYRQFPELREVEVDALPQ